MEERRIEQGTITQFDAARGVASVRLAGCSAELHAAAFFSSPAARLPRVGDAVSVQLSGPAAAPKILVAKLVANATPTAHQ